jgi:hypothetical protein
MRAGGVVAVVALLAICAAAVVVVTRHPAPAPDPGADSVRVTAPPRPTNVQASQRAPDSVRIKVEILNASTVRGLARRATMHLRDRGFDVVFTGGTDERHDSTLVLDRSHHPAWAQAVARALGSGARVEERPDSSRYLDVTVLLGAAWRPPSQPFYP